MREQKQAYRVKEAFYTLQGEGVNSGRPAVFCRFEGCNLWSGLERDRDVAVCQFCDTDFVGTDGSGGGLFASAQALASAISDLWPTDLRPERRPLVVLTGGEPALQVDEALVQALHAEGFEVAMETNGTLPVPTGIDCLTVSPKAGARLVVTGGTELKLVFPQDGIDPSRLSGLQFAHFFLSPKDSPEREQATRLALDFCLANPPWRLSIQTHKILGIR